MLIRVGHIADAIDHAVVADPEERVVGIGDGVARRAAALIAGAEVGNEGRIGRPAPVLGLQNSTLRVPKKTSWLLSAATPIVVSAAISLLAKERPSTLAALATSLQ